MTESTTDIRQWHERVKGVKNKAELFQVLDEFRPLDWTDEQRAGMAKLYMRVIDTLANQGEEVWEEKDATTADAMSFDGPVWYEKM